MKNEDNPVVLWAVGALVVGGLIGFLVARGTSTIFVNPPPPISAPVFSDDSSEYEVVSATPKFYAWTNLGDLPAAGDRGDPTKWDSSKYKSSTLGQSGTNPNKYYVQDVFPDAVAIAYDVFVNLTGSTSQIRVVNFTVTPSVPPPGTNASQIIYAYASLTTKDAGTANQKPLITTSYDWQLLTLAPKTSASDATCEAP